MMSIGISHFSVNGINGTLIPMNFDNNEINIRIEGELTEEAIGAQFVAPNPSQWNQEVEKGWF